MRLAALVAGPEGNARLRQFPVEVRTVDSVLPSPPHPITFIKCDVEGHEAEAIEGTARAIERDRPALCVEVTGDPDVPDYPAIKSCPRWPAWRMNPTGSAATA